MIIGVDRRRRGPDPHLDWKVRIFLAGAAIALVGIALESGIVVGVATAILLVGFGLRFMDRDGDDGDDEDDEEDQQEEDPDGDEWPGLDERRSPD